MMRVQCGSKLLARTLFHQKGMDKSDNAIRDRLMVKGFCDHQACFQGHDLFVQVDRLYFITLNSHDKCTRCEKPRRPVGPLCVRKQIHTTRAVAPVIKHCASAYFCKTKQRLATARAPDNILVSFSASLHCSTRLRALYSFPALAYLRCAVAERAHAACHAWWLGRGSCHMHGHVR